MRRVVVFSLLLCFFIPLNIEAKKKPFGNGLYWEMTDNGILIISGNGDMINFKGSGDSPWYSNRNKIHKVIIEEGVTSIGSFAFTGKYQKDYIFEEISFPSTLKKIELSSFCDNKNLRALKFNEGLEYIGYNAFFSCSGLTKIEMPNTIKEIGENCFFNCKNLTELTLSNNLHTISEESFAECKNLSNIVIPPGVEKIEKQAFMGCKGTMIQMPIGVKHIGSQAFYGNCSNTLCIPHTVTFIGPYAFCRKCDFLEDKHTFFYGDIVSLPSFVSKINANKYGIDEKSVDEYENGIRDSEGKLLLSKKEGRSIIQIGSSNWIVEEGLNKGIINKNGKWIIPLTDVYSEIKYIGDNYIKMKQKYYYCVMTLDGREIIPISRGYTYIGDYNSSKETFAFTKKGFSGVCDAQGREISTARLAPTADDIKENAGYASAVEMKNGSTKYYKVSKGGRYGLTDSEGREIIPCEMEALESAGSGYLKYKLNGFWGVMNFTGKIIIDTDRGYTSIGDFKTFNKRFAYTMTGYKGECDAIGRQISKIKVETPKQNTSVASSPNSSSSSSSSSNSSGSGTTTIVVEHHRDPIPVQEWQQCTNCWGEGKVMCLGACGGTGTYYVGDRLHICNSCGGTGKKTCPYCGGQGGKNITVYR